MFVTISEILSSTLSELQGVGHSPGGSLVYVIECVLS